MPYVCEQESPQFVSARLRLARVGVLLYGPLLPLDVTEVKEDERRPYQHGLKLKEPRNHQLIKLLANQLQLNNLVHFQIAQDLLKRQARDYILR